MDCEGDYDEWKEKWENYLDKREEYIETVKDSDDSFVKSGDAIGTKKWGTAISEGLNSVKKAWKAEGLKDELEDLEGEWEEAADGLWECLNEHPWLVD